MYGSSLDSITRSELPTVGCLYFMHTLFTVLRGLKLPELGVWSLKKNLQLKID
jgi:hypothetical protein